MKKIILFALILFAANFVFARKVKFSVDMDTITINPTGVHVMGDFQAAAGFPGGDWLPNTTTMTQEASSTIYSVIVDIPAFTKYEYKFVNGDQSYEAEFVPVLSRVGYNFNDNRWLWVDSLANDTTDVGAIVFAANAPANLTLLRFKVNANLVPSLNPAGMHVAGDFQSWDPSKIMLYSFGSGVYEIISYLPVGIYEYKYYNGNTSGDAENVPLACAVNTNRQVMLSTDTILHDVNEYAVCFSGCATCATGLAENANANRTIIYPNPATNQFTIYPESSGRFTISKIELYDAQGHLLISQQQTTNNKQQTFDISPLKSGIYLLRISDTESAHVTTTKLVIE
jgi:hypothetical protein